MFLIVNLYKPTLKSIRYNEIKLKGFRKSYTCIGVHYIYYLGFTEYYSRINPFQANIPFLTP